MLISIKVRIASIRYNFQLEDKYNISFCVPPQSPSESPGSSKSDSIQGELKIKLPRKPSPKSNFPPTPEDITRYREEHEKVVINIGGSKFEVKRIGECIDN